MELVIHPYDCVSRAAIDAFIYSTFDSIAGLEVKGGINFHFGLDSTNNLSERLFKIAKSYDLVFMELSCWKEGKKSYLKISLDYMTYDTENHYEGLIESK